MARRKTMPLETLHIGYVMLRCPIEVRQTADNTWDVYVRGFFSDHETRAEALAEANRQVEISQEAGYIEES